MRVSGSFKAHLGQLLKGESKLIGQSYDEKHQFGEEIMRGSSVVQLGIGRARKTCEDTLGRDFLEAWQIGICQRCVI